MIYYYNMSILESQYCLYHKVETKFLIQIHVGGFMSKH